MLKDVRPPHILLASGNMMKLLNNLNHILAPAEITKLTDEINKNVIGLYELGIAHYKFARRVADQNWRQKISRLYYASYNAKRAISLKNSGEFSTDSSDHQNIMKLPDGFNNGSTYATFLKTLRDDRNIADYSHLATMSDLIMTPGDAASKTKAFLDDCKQFLISKAVPL
ncbi:hypothetical protein GJ654_13345 [Rhodoblastus acidophilus]|uniref:HEPN domain-containing protein n=1 Tax=Rhodoblastus acidophilus TaxID=1074 RepID=A0A6N8DN00_RHOAC|nr:hypothetical protein [Rhodoblastus acidophilus]MCW2275472.1 hypothetical protein [Rhodoblastus acidophilus]MTV31972.1 hypothetical protein [Rhodoblastus acidophilus]